VTHSRGARTGLCVLALLVCWSAGADERRNVFNDPFVQVTGALPACPAPAGPLFSDAYLYDREIIPRVARAIHADGRFERTSIWTYGQRRWVWLQGCVNTEAESQEVERLIRNIDDVETVINELSIGVDTRPRYEMAR
jgi:hypothetical protein